MSNKKKIVCAHLLNDYSGSPRILSQVVGAFIEEGKDVDLYTSKSETRGFLSDIPGVNDYNFFYRWSNRKILTLIFFLFSQFILFFKMLKYRKEDVVFYINTVLPFGVALAGKLMNKKVVYHIHETTVRPLLLKKFLFYIVRYTCSDAIYVSNFLLDQERVKGVNCHVVYNSLNRDFISVSDKFQSTVTDSFNVLMLSSLKEYKGVYEFIELAKGMKEISFELVINACQIDIDKFFHGSEIPSNLLIYSSQSDVHQFYKRANLVLNLSHPLKWVETFGMTALEAMSYGIPVIVPPVGGIAEIVDEGFCGCKIDVRQMDEMKRSIKKFYSDNDYYTELSEGAREKSKQFNPDLLAAQILKIAA